MSGEGEGSVGFVGLAEIEEKDHGVPVLAVSAGAAATRRCACGAVRLGDQVVHREDGCRPITFAVLEEVPYPAPEVTSRDAWDGAGAPSAVEKLAQEASAASWAVRVQRSRGSAPHAVHGAPGVLKWRYAVVMSVPGAGAYAVYDGTTWKSVMVWGRSLPWFPHASRTDLSEYIAARGAVGQEWVAAVRARVAGADARKKERAACDRGTHSRAFLQNGMVHCPACDRTWPVNQAAPKKMGAKKEGAS